MGWVINLDGQEITQYLSSNCVELSVLLFCFVFVVSFFVVVF